MAKYLDGVGYDVLTVEDGRLCRVEVKSASGGRRVMHFSEAECAAAQQLLAEPDGPDWRVVLFVEEDGVFVQYDATARVREALRDFRRSEGPLYPVSYVVEINQD